ncbi:hypothetical protein MN116_001580 [Schistosoma mekongi]|uniref:Uncharacterized protein n=1 Tax=Schistosoma mekongi TaxID=38744 RepID=A0AAE1ZI75_SCHME|nr:hypothetical protein MN116_001580 [Schistosoma mekongi]
MIWIHGLHIPYQLKIIAKLFEYGNYLNFCQYLITKSNLTPEYTRFSNYFQHSSSFPKQTSNIVKYSNDTLMASMDFPFLHGCKSHNLYANPDVYTSAGVVATTYSRFKTSFWIDRILFILTVCIPVIQALILLLLHTILGVTRCLPDTKETTIDYYSSTNAFIDRACGLQLTTEVLQGTVKPLPNSFRSSTQINPEAEITGKEISTIRLQHECYPFVLIIYAIAMWIPHYLYHRSTDRTARRDLCLVRAELHSFRRAVTQELAYLQTLATASTDVGAPTGTFLSPVSTIPTGPTFHQNSLYFQHAPSGYGQNDGTSGRTTAATFGGASGLSQQTAPTVIHAQQSTTIGTMRGDIGDSPGISPALPMSFGDADLSAPGLLDLPCFHACHADWSLNTYLAAWQNTDFYWSRYITKHIVLTVFQGCAILFIFIIIGIYKGTPFAPLFICQINESQPPHKLFICMLQTTFIVNMSVLSLGFLNVTGLILQIIYFYENFIHIFWLFNTSGSYMGVTTRPNIFLTGVDESRRCFFADYIRLLAYTAFKDTHCEIRTLTVSYSPHLYCSDFHFLSLLCNENAHLLSDSIHIHYWTERYARLCCKRFRRPYWAIRRGSLGHLVRCEDLSMKFNFSKIKIRVEVNDFGF